MIKSPTPFLCLLLVFSFLGCNEDPTPVIDAKDQAVEELITEVRNKDMRSFMIAHHDEVEGRYLFNGNENTGYDLRSVTKSITTTLIGIAIDKGYIESENETIDQYLEPITGPIPNGKGSLKIIDLMTMTAGAVDEFFNAAPYFAWLAASDHFHATFHTSLNGTYGTFTYNNAQMYLLSVILQQATGMTAKEFARIHLFEPMDISSRKWETIDGYNNGGAGIVMSPAEMVKFGLLYLNKGLYNGKQIVSEEWINKAYAPYVATTGYGNYHYGFGWWLGTTDDGVAYAYALGWAGQFIFVVPELDLVVTATHTLDASESASINNTVNTREFVVNRIIPHYKQKG